MIFSPAQKRVAIKTATDPLSGLIAAEDNPQDTNEFPDGFVHFACAPRFGTHIVDAELTVTGRSYEITREGTKVDVKDMEALMSIRRKFYCPRDRMEYEIPPIGITRL